MVTFIRSLIDVIKQQKNPVINNKTDDKRCQWSHRENGRRVMAIKTVLNSVAAAACMNTDNTLLHRCHYLAVPLWTS